MVLLYSKLNTPYRIAYFRGTATDKNLLTKMGFIIGKQLTIINKSQSDMLVSTDNKQIRIANNLAEKVLLR